MNYKYITGQVLEIDPSSGWTDGTLLQDIYPDSSFVSGQYRQHANETRN